MHGPGSPSVSQAPQGNAVLMVLPAGTVLELPSQETADMALALFVNELKGAVLSEAAGAMPKVGALRAARPTNELAPTGWGAANGGEDAGVRPPRLTLTKPLRLASPAYILERDLREMELLQRVEELKLENLQLRGK